MKHFLALWLMIGLSLPSFGSYGTDCHEPRTRADLTDASMEIFFSAANDPSIKEVYVDEDGFGFLPILKNRKGLIVQSSSALPKLPFLEPILQGTDVWICYGWACCNDKDAPWWILVQGQASTEWGARNDMEYEGELVCRGRGGKKFVDDPKCEKVGYIYAVK